MAIQAPCMELPFSPGQNEGMKPSILLPSVMALSAAFAAEPEIRVRLFDETSLNAQDSEVLRSKARQILERAGISVVWLDCPPKPSPESPRACHETLAPSDVVIRILPRTMIGNDNGLGASVAGREGGVYGLVFRPRVQEAAKVVDVSVPVMLALVVVHEIGHLILGSQTHWPVGIMHPRWDRKVVADMIGMDRYFNQSQSRQLQARLLTRK